MDNMPRNWIKDLPSSLAYLHNIDTIFLTVRDLGLFDQTICEQNWRLLLWNLIDRSEDFIIQTSIVIWKFESHEFVLGSTASSMTGFIVIKVA